MELNVDMDDLRKKKIFLSAPMYGGNCHGLFCKSVVDLMAECTKRGITLYIHYLFNESLITRARNYCADEFLRSDADVLLFIDSDIGFNPMDVLTMLAMTIADHKKYNVLGAPYPKKCISWEKVIQAVNAGAGSDNPGDLEGYVGDFVFNLKHGSSFDIREPVEVLETGTGFMMITRETLQTMAKNMPRLEFRPDHVRTKNFDGSRMITMFFQAEIDQLDSHGQYGQLVEGLKQKMAKTLADSDESAAESVREMSDILEKFTEQKNEAEKRFSKRYLSEDYWFCQQVQRLGMHVWLCPWMRTQHVGSYIFGGTLQQLASVGASLTADPKSLKK